MTVAWLKFYADERERWPQLHVHGFYETLTVYRTTRLKRARRSLAALERVASRGGGQ